MLLPERTVLVFGLLCSTTFAIPHNVQVHRTTATSTTSENATTTTSVSPNPTDPISSPVSTGVKDPANAKVTNLEAFLTGAGNTLNLIDNDSTQYGRKNIPQDRYICYSGGADAYPDKSQWISYEDMFAVNYPLIASGCTRNNYSAIDSSPQQISQIKSAIDTVAAISFVDHRYILATIMQESSGCVNVPTTSNGVNNPGLMQSFRGITYVGNGASVADQGRSILQQIIDGSQGTHLGDGLTQCINYYGNVYAAARCYNSGTVALFDLNNPFPSTASYVNDIGNRLTGWVFANSTFKECFPQYNKPATARL